MLRNLSILWIVASVAGIGACATDGTSGPMVEKPAAADSCQLTMGYDPWEPYQYRDVDGTVRGLDVEIVTAVARRAACDLAFVESDWATLLGMVKSGQIDLLTGATRTAARERYAYFSAPYREESFVLYVRKGEASRFPANTLAGLLDQSFRLGVTVDYLYGPEVTQLRADERYRSLFREAAVGEVNYSMLLGLTIDGFLEDPVVGAAILRKRGLHRQIEAHPLNIHSGDVHLMLSKASLSPKRVARLNAGLEAIRADGTYDKLMGKYLN